MRRWLRALLVIPLVFGLPALSADNVAASPTCGTQSGHFAGYLGYSRLPASWSETPEGVSGYIVTRNAITCTNLSYPYTFSTAWMMLEDQGIGDHYAQAGYIWYSQMGCMRYFTEWNVGNGNNRLLGACSAEGTRRAYSVQYEGAAGPYPTCCGYMQLDGWGVVDNANFDPWYQGWSFAPFFAGEVTHLSDDIPGYLYAVTEFSALGIQQVTTGNLRPVPCYLKRATLDRPQFYEDANACDHTWIYTSPAGVG